MGARVSYLFYFLGPVRSAAGPGRRLGSPAQAWLLLASVLQAASLYWLAKTLPKSRLEIELISRRTRLSSNLEVIDIAAV